MFRSGSCPKAELDHKLHQIHPMDLITAEYFQDGEYVQITGVVTEIDEINRRLNVVGTQISFDDIFGLKRERQAANIG